MTAFNTTGGQIGGDDELTGGSGLDVLLGGAGSDKLLGKENTGFLAGDCAEIVFETNSAARLAKYFYTTDYGVKGNDELTGGSGIDILFGGSGADQIVGGGGYNMLAGDGARVDFQSNSQQRTVQRFMTTGGAHGGPSSPFRVSVCAARTLNVTGQSRVTLSLQLEHLKSSLWATAGGNEPNTRSKRILAGHDTVRGGSTVDVILGGPGDDKLFGSEGVGFLAGDCAHVEFEANQASYGTAGLLVQYFNSTDLEIGGDDEITGGSSLDVVIGGHGSDVIKSAEGVGLLAGDSGEVVFEPKSTSRLVEYFVSTGGAFGGNDTILGGSSLDVIMGGAGMDVLNSNGGNGLLAGDHAHVKFQKQSSQRLIDVFQSVDNTVGNSDSIYGGSSVDAIIGGAGSDVIDSKEGNGFVAGDGGWIKFRSSSQSWLVDSFHTVGATGGDDVIKAGSSLDVLLGGVGGDKIDGGAGAGFLAGDGADVAFDTKTSTRVVKYFHTIDDSVGGDDELTGGQHQDVLLGGAGSDKLKGAEGVGFLAGDCGRVDFESKTSSNAGSMVQCFNSTASAKGGNDELTGGSEIDVLLGGSGADTLDGARPAANCAQASAAPALNVIS